MSSPTMAGCRFKWGRRRRQKVSRQMRKSFLSCKLALSSDSAILMIVVEQTFGYGTDICEASWSKQTNSARGARHASIVRIEQTKHTFQFTCTKDTRFRVNGNTVNHNDGS